MVKLEISKLRRLKIPQRKLLVVSQSFFECDTSKTVSLYAKHAQEMGSAFKIFHLAYTREIGIPRRRIMESFYGNVLLSICSLNVK